MARTKITTTGDIGKVRAITFGGTPLVKWYAYIRDADGDLYLQRESGGVRGSEAKVLTCGEAIVDFDFAVDPVDPNQAWVYFIINGQARRFGVNSLPIGELPTVVTCVPGP